MIFKPLHYVDDVDAATLFRIYDGLRDHSLPKAEWTHYAHLAAATCLLSEHGLTRAKALMPDIIRSYNEAVGGTNSDTEGYHHTITLLYLYEIHTFMNQSDEIDLVDTVKALLRSKVAERTYPLSFYSKEHLFSVKARREWVAPDL